MTKRHWFNILVLMLIVSLITPTMGSLPRAVAAGASIQADFEDGTAQGWYGRGDTVTVATDQAHGGTYSLKSTGRTQGWMGPGINATALAAAPGAYDFRAWVKLESGHADAQVKATVESQVAGSSSHSYNQLVGATTVNGSTWTELAGTYTIGSGLDYIQIYFESPDATLSFYIDDVSFKPHETPVPSNTVLNSDFESGTDQSWYGRWGPTVAAVTTQAHGGAYSLLTTGRDAGWKGPAITITSAMEKGAKYAIEGWVRTVSGDDKNVSLSVLREHDGGQQQYLSVAYQVAVNSTGWTKLSGTFDYKDAAETLNLYFESSDPTLAFYIDDVTIVKTEEASTDFANGFEDATSQGWGARIGSENISVVTDVAHGGTYSLKVANRTATYAGASKDVTESMRVGSTYRFSAWARLVSGAAAETVKMTMQTDKGTAANYIPITFDSATSSQWVKLEGEYAYGAQVDKLTLYFESEHAGVDFYIDDVQMTKSLDQGSLQIQKDIPSLKDVYANDFLIGTAFTNDELAGANAELIAKHFNSVTPGNILKWDSTEPTEGNFNWDGPDEAVNFAVDNGIQIRGHTLVWHSQTPEWAFYDANHQLVSKEVLYARLKNHIDAVVGRYKGKMYAWDVVNEAIDESQPDGMRRSLWYQIAGEEYIEKAFEYARAADPDAKLYINDYNTESPGKAQQLYNLVQRMKEKGVPIDGVGHQVHIDIEYPPVDRIERTILKFADLGVQQQITEMDMSVYTNDGQRFTSFTQEMAVQQAYRYKEIMEMLKRHKDLVNSVTWWGKDDGHTWLTTFPVARNNWPLLFDKQLQAKYAYWAIVDPSKVPILTRKADAYGGSPTVDGETEFAWNALSAVAVQGSSTLGVQFKTMWDAERLYVLADVTDATANAADGLKIYVNQGAPTSYGLTRSGVAINGAEYRVTERAGGYRIEAAILMGGELAALNSLGFDIRAVDTDIAGGGGVVSWNDRTNGEPSDAANWGLLTLRGEMKVADAMKGTPVIGAFDDNAWCGAFELSTDTWVQGTSGATAKVMVLWDAGHLYVQAKVTDPVLSDSSVNAWEQDSVEIFIDPNNHKATSYEADDGQYRISFNNAASFGDTTPQAGFSSATKLTPEGYEVEAVIPVTAVTLAQDAIFGFDVQVNDDAGSGSRSSVATWSDASGTSYKDTSKFGVLRLLTPTPIADFASAGHHQTSATFAWTAAFGANGISIEQSTDNGATWTKAATTGTIATDASSATVTGLTPNAGYKFRLVVAGGRNAGTSNELSVKTDSAPIANFANTEKKSTTASFSWSAAVGASGVEIQQSADGGRTWTTAATKSPIAPNTSFASIKGLKPHTVYKFRLVVVGGQNDGTSNVVTVATDKEHKEPR
ncbi:endo-1,4-beta-xylanase [Cohnella suwonensis]|uniref:Beta-xylanase n=1 Tax=Cohnella suwonensis TaxID=696072 RepID=A0ABW0LYM2_9BACL